MSDDTLKQPAPKPGVEDVTAGLGARIAKIHEARRAAGIREYGTPLQTFNGRDALDDADAELADAQAYVHQARKERDAVRTDLAEMRTRVANLRAASEQGVALYDRLLATERGKVEALAAFKAYVHQRLDAAGIPTHPDGQHSKQGCRVGDRLDIALAKPTTPVHLPAQMGELQRALDSEAAELHRELDSFNEDVAPIITSAFMRIARRLPIQHDDQQGGKPACEPAPPPPAAPSAPESAASAGGETTASILRMPTPRDPVAVGGSICAECLIGDHRRHDDAWGGICIGCACGVKITRETVKP